MNQRSGHKIPGLLDTLSSAYHMTGDTAKAIGNQKKAIALLPAEKSALRTYMEKSLAEFEAALKSGKE